MPEVEAEITPQERGSLFHLIAFRFYKERKEDGISKVTEKELKIALDQIKKIAEEELNKYPYKDPVWIAFKRRYMGDNTGRPGLLEAFLNNEALDVPSAFSPEHFELSIGIPLNQILLIKIPKRNRGT